LTGKVALVAEGVEKPAGEAGTLTLKVVEPAAFGKNWVVAALSPPARVTWAGVTVPTVEDPALVTCAVAERPPAMAWVATQSPVALRRAEETITFDGWAAGVVRIGFGAPPNGFVKTMPDGARVTVPVAVPNPAPWAM